MDNLLTNVVPRTQEDRINMKRVSLLAEILEEIKGLREDLKPKEEVKEIEVKPKEIKHNKKSKKK
jgi:hypothetical protein